MALIHIITQGPLTKLQEGGQSFQVLRLGCGVQRKRGFGLYLGVPTCWHLPTGKVPTSGAPYLLDQVIRDRGAEADELSTGHCGWMAHLSASLLVTQAGEGACPPAVSVTHKVKRSSSRLCPPQISSCQP